MRLRSPPRATSFTDPCLTSPLCALPRFVFLGKARTARNGSIEWAGLGGLAVLPGCVVREWAGCGPEDWGG